MAAAAPIPLRKTTAQSHPAAGEITQPDSARRIRAIWEAEQAAAEWYDGGLPPEPPHLYLVPDELEPEWDSEDSNAFQDRVEAGLEPQYPDDPATSPHPDR